MGKCIRCGNPCPDNENMCDDCRAWLEEKTKGSTVSGADKGQNTQKIITRPVAKPGGGGGISGGAGQEQKPKKGPVLWVILAAAAVIAVVVIIAALSGRGEKKKGKNAEPAMEALTAGAETTEAAEAKAKPDEETIFKESETETAQPQEPETETEPPAGAETEPPYDITEGGIHRYDYIVEDCTWSEAFEKAKMMGGYLAHINSQEEFDYIINEITALKYENIMFRIGGRRNMRETEYYWVNERNRIYGELINGPEYWNHSLWMKNEPSYQDGEDGEIKENCLDIFYYSGEERWVWNDVPDDILKVVPYYSGKIGYIVEYED